MSIKATPTDEPRSVDTGEFTILPESGGDIRDGAYSSRALSLAKEFRLAGLSFSFHNTPDRVFEQRAADWLGPTLLFASSAYSQNPEIFSLILTIIKKHIEKLYSDAEKAKIKLQFTIKQNKSSRSTHVEYEGDSKSFPELLSTLEKICESYNSEKK